jgi:hypothetical protein
VLEAIKDLCHPCWFWLKGFIRSRLACCLHTFLSPYPVVFSVTGLLGLNHLVSLCIVSPRYGFVHATDVCAWVMMAIVPRGFLKVDFYFLSLFYLNILRVDWENHEGYTLRVLDVITDQNEAFSPLFIVLISHELSPCLRSCWWYTLCVHHVVSEVLTRCWGSNPVPLCWSTKRTLDYSKPDF